MTSNDAVSPAGVEPVEVARYYLASELDRVFSLVNIEHGTSPNIADLPDRVVWELVEGLSVYYRLNSVYWFAANPAFQWTKQPIDASEVILTGMGKNNITDLLYSDEISNTPLKLKKYLQSYFSEHTHDDPESLDELRPSPRRHILHPSPLFIKRGDKYYLLDGSHRFIEQLMRGVEVFEGYVGEAADEWLDGFPVIGAGQYRLLKNLYNKSSTPQEKEAITTVVKMLAKHSPHAVEYIRESWIDALGNRTDEELAQAAQKMIESLSATKEEA